jgi:hypothetical protein
MLSICMSTLAKQMQLCWGAEKQIHVHEPTFYWYIYVKVGL